ncbi:MAG: class I SAM-dependent methyltransferase [Solirubrobacterales bacterium]
MPQTIPRPTPPHAPADLQPVAESRLGAALYGPVIWLGERLGMAARRRKLLAAAHGRVLELGAGTGLNLRRYPSEGIEELVLTEPGGAMAARIDTSRFPGTAPVRLLDARAEALPFPDASFDTVVSTLVLCTVAEPALAVAEARRVLRPGGRLLFLEHVRSETARWARWQDRLAGPWATFAEGCQCNRDTLATIAAELEVEAAETASWGGMVPVVRPLVIGAALAS